VPKVTVLLPAYNAGTYLDAAIDSICNQTYSDFELLVVDDGSTDSSIGRLQIFRDQRVRIVRNDSNLGLIATLNRGLREARGEFIARMDADDIAHPRRLERQVTFLDERANIGLCGTWFQTFDGYPRRTVRPPTEPEEVHARLFVQSPLGHPTVMFRRRTFEEFRLSYDAAYPHCEDYELWTRAAMVTRLANLPEVLLKYRMHPAQVSSAKRGEQEQTLDRIRGRQLRRLHPDVTAQEESFHLDLLAQRNLVGSDVLKRVEEWLLFLIEKNERCPTPPFPRTEFRALLRERWLQICAAYPELTGAATAFYRSPLKSGTAAFAVARTRRLAGDIYRALHGIR